MPGPLDNLEEAIRELQDLYDDPDILTTADKIDRPERALEKQAIDDFMDRNPMAGGGMLVQPSADGSRPGYAKVKKGAGGMNIGNEKKRTDAFQPFIDKYTEETLNKISRKKYKKNFKNLKGDNLRNLKDRLNKFESFILENNRMPTETEAREIGRAPRTLKEADIQIKLLNATNKQDFFDPKKFAKDNNISMQELKKQADLLQTNIYKKRMILSGKENIRAKLKWLPDDANISDNALNKLWKSKLIKYERNKIDEIFYDAFGREFIKGTKDKNPTYNPKKFLAIKNNLNEYRQLRDAINARFPNINFELDHPLSKSSLNKLFNATTDQLTRVNVLEADLNNGFKDTLSLQYEKAVQGNDLNKKKAVEKIAKDLNLNIGKISDDATNFKYGVKEFQKLNIKDEIGKSLQNLSALNKNFQTYAKNNPELFKAAGVSTQQTFTRVDNIKGLVPFMKELGIACKLSDGINCMNPQAYTKSLNELSVKASQGDAAAASKLKNFTSKVATTGKFLKSALGPLAVATEFALEGGIALNKTLSEGIPFKQAFADSYINKYLLGPKTKIDKEAEIAKEMAKGEEFAMAKRGERMMLPQGESAVNRRLKKREEEMKALYPQLDMVNLSNKEIDTMLADRGVYSPFTLGFGMQQRQPGIGDMRYNEDVAYDEIRDIFNKGAEEDIRRQQMQNIAEAGGVANLAKGGRAGFKSGTLRKGILKLIDDSVKSTPKDTTTELDKLIKKTLDEDLFDKKDRIVDSINISEAKKRRNYPYNQQVFEEPKNLDFYDAITKSNFKTKTGPYFDRIRRLKKAGGGLLKQAGDRSGPPPESGPNSQGLQGLLNRVKNT